AKMLSLIHVKSECVSAAMQALEVVTLHARPVVLASTSFLSRSYLQPDASRATTSTARMAWEASTVLAGPCVTAAPRNSLLQAASRPRIAPVGTHRLTGSPATRTSP